MKDYKELSGGVYLVTGATSGIGYRIAVELLEQGANVILNYGHDDKKAEIARCDLNKYSDRLRFLKADVSSEKEVREMLREIDSEFGRLDGLINNAGICESMSIIETDSEVLNQIMYTNFNSKLLCIKYAVPLLKKSEKSPCIVNIASRSGIVASRNFSAYCCSEAAVLMLTRVATIELSALGIRVNSVSPAITDTPLSARCVTDETRRYVINSTPAGRIGKTEDIANAVLWLLSSESEFVYGENLGVNGGSIL